MWLSMISTTKKYNVHLFLEGFEEEYFFEIVKQFGVHENIDLTFENVEGFGNIAPYYQAGFGSGEHDCLLCVYDVDYRQEEEDSPYNEVASKLESILGDSQMVQSISFCTNPNILQILLLGCDSLNNILLMNGSKKANSPIVKKYWPKIKKPYDAKEWQLEIIKDSYVYGTYTYDDLFNNCSSLSNTYLAMQPGSNIFKLLKALKDGDIEFFEEINKQVNYTC